MYEPLESQRDNGATNRGFAFVEFESHMDASTVKVRSFDYFLNLTKIWRKTFWIVRSLFLADTIKMWTGLIRKTRRMIPSCQLWKTSMSKVSCSECDGTQRQSSFPLVVPLVDHNFQVGPKHEQRKKSKLYLNLMELLRRSRKSTTFHLSISSRENLRSKVFQIKWYQEMIKFISYRSDEREEFWKWRGYRCLSGET